MATAKYEDLSSISSTTFELPASLSRRLGQVSDQVYKGHGLQVVRGIDPSKYSPRQDVILYAGVSAYVCPQRGFSDVDAQRVVGMSRHISLEDMLRYWLLLRPCHERPKI